MGVVCDEQTLGAGVELGGVVRDPIDRGGYVTEPRRAYSREACQRSRSTMMPTAVQMRVQRRRCRLGVRSVKRELTAFS